MPRRSTRASNNSHSVIGVSSQPLQQVSGCENLSLLRRQWKWASFSQFFYTFNQLFSLDDVTVTHIENDLVCGSKAVIPRIMQKLLYSLSYDRKVSIDNWQKALRKQYHKRDPDANLIGPEISMTNEGRQISPVAVNGFDSEEQPRSPHTKSNTLEESSIPGPSGLQEINTSSRASEERTHDAEKEEEKFKDWFDLSMLEKLESLHTIVEWQFQNPTRLRTIMKSDDELASWRIEPIGYDSKSNAYWHIGGDRLWIQRMSPKPVKPKSLKRKRNTDNKVQRKARRESSQESVSAKHQRLNRALVTSHESEGPSPSERHRRAAKDHAKLKLNVQAKQLADALHQRSQQSTKVRGLRSSSRSQSSKSIPRALGTRVSARLRGNQNDEWQPIPPEWLGGTSASKGVPAKKTGLESDDEASDLTELSDDGEEAIDSKVQDSTRGSTEHDDQGPDHIQSVSADFVEWETICVTLQDWEHISERFEHATHYNEKALFKILVNDIVPYVTQALREIQHQREVEDALAHRKRSSRIALKESEREEARLSLLRKQEEEEKQGRARRAEARRQKEEAERVKRELAREQRRKERESREESRKAQTFAQKEFHETEDNSTNGSQASSNRLHDVQGTRYSNTNRKLTTTPFRNSRDDWELACEICLRQGINLDDGTPMMSCGRCSKWQHILCHDRADRAANRPRRNWDSVDFVCQSCLRVTRPRFDPKVAQQHAYDSSTQPQIYRSQQHQNYSPGYPENMHLPSPREPIQTYYNRSNGHQAHYPQPVTRPLTFSHYQSPAQGFSGTQKTHVEPYPYYNQSFQFRPTYPATYDSQGSVGTWNVNRQAQASAHVVPHNPDVPNSMPYRHQVSIERQEGASYETSPSFLRYSNQPYPPQQYNHQPTSHQPPLGR